MIDNIVIFTLLLYVLFLYFQTPGFTVFPWWFGLLLGWSLMTTLIRLFVNIKDLV